MLTLCQLLGFPHPDYLLPLLDARQYADWDAWLKHYYPFPDRADIQWGLLTASVQSQWSDRPVAVADVMPYRDPFADDIDLADLKALVGWETL